jgi:glycosyltransferase involved in cell wall biosynthesis
MKREQKPLISIITATYNSENDIERCINSVLNQTYTDIEYIIVDGASKDATVDIIKKYDNRDIKWISEPDTGVYDAWNKGIDLAKGTWIAFIGSDDLLYPDAMQNYVDHLNNGTHEVDFISSRVHVVNKNGIILRTLGWAWNWKTSRRENNIAHPGALHSKKLLIESHKYNTEYKIVGDYELMLRAGPDLKTDFMDIVTLKMQIGGLSDSYKVYLETLTAISKNSGLSYPIVGLDFAIAFSKFFIRRAFRLIGVNIALKK